MTQYSREKEREREREGVRQNKREKKNILKICTILKNILFQQRSRSDDKPIRFPSYVIRVIESVLHC